MPPTAKLKLANHGHFLAEYLRQSRKFIQTDLVIRCSDGDVKMHKIVLAARTVSTSLIKTLKGNVDDETIYVLIPEAKKKSVENLVQLLYTAKVDHLSEDDIKDLNAVSNLLKLDSLSLSVVEGNPIEGTSSTSEGQLSIELIEKKRPIKAVKEIPPEDEDSNSIRRSKRSKIKNKLLSAYETPLKGTPMVEDAILKGN